MNKLKQLLATTACMLLFASAIQAQYPVFKGCPVTVDFSKNLRTWDGFGFNYVETAQTVDYD
jgi:hypothetical protein